MNKKRSFLLLLLLIIHISLVAQRATISGFIRDAENKEVVVDAMVFVNTTNMGTRTNEAGYFSLTLAQSQYDIVFLLMDMKSNKSHSI